MAVTLNESIVTHGSLGPPQDLIHEVGGDNVTCVVVGRQLSTYSHDCARAVTPPTPSRRDARADADLHAPCSEGNLVEVKRILDTGRADVNSRDGVGMTPMMWAAYKRHRDVVKLLVSRGADVSLVTDGGDNILHWACRGGDRKTVEFVLSLDGVDVNAKNNSGLTAVDVERLWEHHELSEFLVSPGTQCCVI
ncbi:integrin-linked protein kinase-like [Haliotis asinina]|uniref:integrin-linked protein kinase-like n=1 Tax=Haliotis asinina TaxID=109174 RepID=UPI0035322884